MMVMMMMMHSPPSLTESASSAQLLYSTSFPTLGLGQPGDLATPSNTQFKLPTNLHH
jgi:hypothetical protein